MRLRAWRRGGASTRSRRRARNLFAVPSRVASRIRAVRPRIRHECLGVQFGGVHDAGARWLADAFQVTKQTDRQSSEAEAAHPLLVTRFVEGSDEPPPTRKAHR